MVWAATGERRVAGENGRKKPRMFSSGLSAFGCAKQKFRRSRWGKLSRVIEEGRHLNLLSVARIP